MGERIQAISEARRVLREGGILLAASISRFASALDGIGRSLIRDPKFIEIMTRDLETGQHRNTTENLDYFTTAYLHRAEELLSELVQGGFSNPILCAIEGPLWTVPEPQSEEERNTLMATMRRLESEPSLIGASAHIMGIATK
jgi:hypothetical protein